MQKKILKYSYLCMNCYHVEERNIIMKIPDDVLIIKYIPTIVYNNLGFCPKCNNGKLMQIDNAILQYIIRLNRLGYKTEYCCEGHYFESFPYILFKDELSKNEIEIINNSKWWTHAIFNDVSHITVKTIFKQKETGINMDIFIEYINLFKLSYLEDLNSICDKFEKFKLNTIVQRFKEMSYKTFLSIEDGNIIINNDIIPVYINIEPVIGATKDDRLQYYAIAYSKFFNIDIKDYFYYIVKEYKDVQFPAGNTFSIPSTTNNPLKIFILQILDSICMLKHTFTLNLYREYVLGYTRRPSLLYSTTDYIYIDLEEFIEYILKLINKSLSVLELLKVDDMIYNKKYKLINIRRNSFKPDIFYSNYIYDTLDNICNRNLGIVQFPIDSFFLSCPCYGNTSQKINNVYNIENVKKCIYYIETGLNYISANEKLLEKDKVKEIYPYVNKLSLISSFSSSFSDKIGLKNIISIGDNIKRICKNNISNALKLFYFYEAKRYISRDNLTKFLNKCTIPNIDEVSCTHFRYNYFSGHMVEPSDIAQREFQQPHPHIKTLLINAFENKFKRVPKILDVITNAYSILNKYYIGNNYLDTLDKFVNTFNINSIKNVADFNNPYLIFTAYFYDLSNLDFDSLLYLNYYMNKQTCLSYIESNMIKHLIKNMNNISTDNLDLIFDNIKLVYDCNNIKDAKNTIIRKQAIKEKESFEADYTFKFEDNTCIIKDTDELVINGKYKMYILKPDDIRLFTIGISTHCCYRYDHAAEDSLLYSVTMPNSSALVIEDIKTKQIRAQAWIWLSKDNTLVLDNIEFDNDRDYCDYIDIIIEYITKSPYDEIHLGLGYNTIDTSLFTFKGTKETFKKIPRKYNDVDFLDIYDEEMEDLYSDYEKHSHVILKKNNIIYIKKDNERNN